MKQYKDSMYSVTEDGKVINIKIGTILKGGNSNGYRLVRLYHKGCAQTIHIHKLVAELFISNPENKPCINHKNGKKYDNRVENLEWSTYSENTKHAYDTGLRKGRGKGKTKLTYDDYCNICEIYAIGLVNQTIIAGYYNVSQNTISNIVKNFKNC